MMFSDDIYIVDLLNPFPPDTHTLNHKGRNGCDTRQGT